MPNGTPLEIGHFAKLGGAVIANLPREMDSKLALDLAGNGDALAILLTESLTRENLGKALEILGKKLESKPAPRLLIPVGTVTIAATKAPFVAREHFVVNTNDDAPVKISYLGDSFEKWLLGKAEQPFGGSTLAYGKLSRSSVDGPIIAELGGEAKAETTCAELFSLMEAQKNGESGPLLTNGYANIFYIKGVKGVLRAVLAGWSGVGWGVHANPVENPGRWLGGRQVFSRNS